jgi:NAD(P)-dependent dehydrogenase (short-subunit alcohol dehydrogenase family)
MSQSIDRLFGVAGKTALVTGGARGIGLMIARAFIENGVKVYISSRKADVCESVAAELSQAGQCIAVAGDLSQPADVERVASQIAEREQELHILVNNAGNNWGAPLAEYDEDAWERVLSLNLKGLFHVTRELVPLLKNAGKAKDRDPARVINIGSIDGLHVPRFDTYAYSASKAAVHHLTHVLAKELGKDQITVNAIAPGFFPSKMTDWIFTNHGAELLARCPLGRFGEPEDMAGIAIYLASRAGAYVNGAVIPIDGGTIL